MFSSHQDGVCNFRVSFTSLRRIFVIEYHRTVTFPSDHVLGSLHPRMIASLKDRALAPCRRGIRIRDPRRATARSQVYFAVTTKDPTNCSAKPRARCYFRQITERGYFLESTLRERLGRPKGRLECGPVTAKFNICGRTRRGLCRGLAPMSSPRRAASPTRFPRVGISRVTCVNVLAK